MKLSIVTVTYNSAHTIGETLRSLHAQTFRDFEHIIIDGGSEDETLAYVREYPMIVKCISEPDKGIYDAMNKGIAMADGEIVGILNSDDVYAHNEVLRRVLAVFEDASVDAVYGDVIYVDSKNPAKVMRKWRAGPYRPGQFRWGWMPPHPGFFVRRSWYEKYGGFQLGLGTSGDYELMLRFIHRYGASISYLPEVLVRMRAGGASNEHILARLQANRMDRKAWAMNGLKPYWFTLYLKPLRKALQFLRI